MSYDHARPPQEGFSLEALGVFVLCFLLTSYFLLPSPLLVYVLDSWFSTDRPT